MIGSRAIARTLRLAADVIVFEHEVPPVEAVLAAIHDDVSGARRVVVVEVRDEMGAPAAVDAHDHAGRPTGVHPCDATTSWCA
jgi:hypothetical protein